MILGLALFFLAISAANAFFWPGVRRERGEGLVSILIPARNEEETLPGCLASLEGQIAREILVYDDHSTDGTKAVIAAYPDPRVRGVQTTDLPTGWFGKSFACWQLAAQASGDWMLFLDADARLFPHACARMLAEARERNLSLLSCWPKFETEGWAEAILMPMLNWVVFSIFPGPLSLFRNDRSLALAHGACILVRRDVYFRLGGHGTVRGEVFEDTRLAQIWREKGERALSLDGKDLVRVRMYASAAEIWRGFRKNFFLAFRHEISFWVFLALHFFIFVWPFITLNWRASAAVLMARMVLLLKFRQAVWSFALHPFAELFLLALGVASWRQGRTVRWKGREYA